MLEGAALYIAIGIILIICAGISLILFSKVKFVNKRVLKALLKEKLHDEMSLLYSRKELHIREKSYIEKNVKRFLIIVIIGSGISILLSCYSELNPLIDSDNRISREGYGESDKKIKLYYQADNSDKKNPINITVSSMKYPSEEIETKAQRIVTEIPRFIKGDNKDLDHVNSNLELLEKIEGYPFHIKWKTENPLIMDSKGKIDFERLEKTLKETEKESIIMILLAEIQYEDFQNEIEIPVQIFNPVISSEELLFKSIDEEIREIDDTTRDISTITLPDSINGTSVYYSEDSSFTSVAIMILTILTAICIYISSDNEITKMVKERNEQMEMDYPRIINRYALYYSAGMHTKAVWKELCSDYRKSLAKTGERRYAFEEMLYTEAAMADGMGDMAAYNEFASNCGIRKYRHFVSLIEQSLKKGKGEMVDVFLKEADDAVNERIAMVKVKGEEAGTKLLLPMLIMLLIVLTIVIVPAFINLNV